ncbi:MAG: hypothetical protein CLLPBCKN_007436 [Chroococcidiopsis cubana SAG 39.79]|nr:hypothetical protein [Chroococcidiopsis cubana SAG 39.79]
MCFHPFFQLCQNQYPTRTTYAIALLGIVFYKSCLWLVTAQELKARVRDYFGCPLLDPLAKKVS